MRAKQLTQLTLTLLIISAIDNVRNLPQIALFGTTLVFYCFLSAVIFLIPVALVSAQLSSASTEYRGSGGIYHWTCLAFGPKVGLIAIWLQWINTLVWFPTILSFIAATATYFFNPELANNKTYLVSVIIVVFWGMTMLNLFGIHRSASFATIFSVLGTLTSIFLIIIFAAVWIFLGKPIQIHFNLHNLLPCFYGAGSFSSLTAITAIMASLIGIELATVHINEVKTPEKSFPRALFFAVVIILTSMILGALSFALVVPLDQINLVDGVMQIFTIFSDAYHMKFLIPAVVLMILFGCLSGMVGYIISPAKGILQAAESGYLPLFFTAKNRHGVPARILIAQAVIVSLICSAWGLMPSVNGSYWLLTDLSTQLYILMYVFMFLAAVKLKTKMVVPKHLFKIPGGLFGTGITCSLGLIGCVITLIVGFIPPSNIDVGSNLHYFTIFSGGVIAMILPVLGFYAYKNYTRS
ncbi:MAG: APC family permease [Chthoniobacterales bacterium]